MLINENRSDITYLNETGHTLRSLNIGKRRGRAVEDEDGLVYCADVDRKLCVGCEPRRESSKDNR